MTISEMNKRRMELGYSYEKIAELSGISADMVKNILEGVEENITYERLQVLEKIFRKKENILQEAVSVYGLKKKQGEYTLEDYYGLSDDQRVELIDGVFYDMSSPTHIHQIMGGKIFRYFAEYIEKNKGLCIPAYAPLDVQLDCDDRTMVQPDVLIVCDREKFQRGVVYGAPDLVVEVLSKSTRRKDTIKKLQKYADAGVREYWMVDPEKKKVIVYYLEEEEHPVVYGFDEVVPVRIFDGKCIVDFAEIYEQINFLYEKM